MLDDKILIADDEKHLADTLTYAFKREGYNVITVYDGRSAYEAIIEERPMVAILDVNMPGLSGFEILKMLGNGLEMGVLLLTARNDIVDKVLGLEFGADDYVTKPFDMREVLARVASLVRRLKKSEESLDRDGEHHLGQQEGRKCWSSRGVVLDESARSVVLHQEVLELTPKEFDLLLLLISNENRVFSRESLLENIWDYDYDGGPRTVDLHIQRLRKKLGIMGEQAIQTVYRVGYKWVGEGHVRP